MNGIILLPELRGSENRPDPFLPEAPQRIAVFWVINGEITGPGFHISKGSYLFDYKEGPLSMEIYPEISIFEAWNQCQDEDPALEKYMMDDFPHGIVLCNCAHRMFTIVCDPEIFQNESIWRAVLKKYNVPDRETVIIDRFSDEGKKFWRTENYNPEQLADRSRFKEQGFIIGRPDTESLVFINDTDIDIEPHFHYQRTNRQTDEVVFETRILITKAKYLDQTDQLLRREWLDLLVRMLEEKHKDSRYNATLWEFMCGGWNCGMGNKKIYKEKVKMPNYRNLELCD